MQTLLNPGASPEAMREQQTKRDEFRNFLDNPKLGSPFAGPSDPINSRGDLTRQPVNPTMPQSLGGDTVNRPNRSPFVPPNIPQSPSPFPSLADLNPQSRSPFSSWQSSGAQQQQPASPLQKPFEQQLPKRKF